MTKHRDRPLMGAAAILPMLREVLGEFAYQERKRTIDDANGSVYFGGTGGDEGTEGGWLFVARLDATGKLHIAGNYWDGCTYGRSFTRSEWHQDGKAHLREIAAKVRDRIEHRLAGVNKDFCDLAAAEALCERHFDIATYDSAAEPGKDGRWITVAQNIPESGLAAKLAELYVLGYSLASIDVTDVDTMDRLPEADWPT